MQLGRSFPQSRSRTLPVRTCFPLTVICSLLLNFLPAQAAPLHKVSQPAAGPTQSAVQKTLPSGFLTPPTVGDPLAIVLAYLRAQQHTLGLTTADLSDVVVTDRYVSAHNGVTHLYLRQRFNGIEIFSGDLNANVTRDGRIINIGNRFIGSLAARIATDHPALTAVAAVQSTAAALGLKVREPLVAQTNAQGPTQAQRFSSGGISADPIPVQLVYQPRPDGRVQLAWEIVLRLPARAQWLSLRTDATTGELLSQVNWVSEAQDGAQSTPGPNRYLVYALPVESPLAGDRTLLTDPADPRASPFGWHDVDGVVGPEYTSTRGNNTQTYADLVAPNGFGPGDQSAESGGSLVFSYTADLKLPPSSYVDAALTNLFYVTNVVHDILYHYGFDEAAGNFQERNYSGNGQGNDGVKAEGQDYSGTINANFASPPDGTAPTMQMYLGDSPRSLTVNLPLSLSGRYAAVNADFGLRAFQLTGDLVLVDDGNADNAGAVTDGCQSPFSNSGAISGKLALLDRGACSFKAQILAAQAAGAVGVVIANEADSLPWLMADDNTLPLTVTIGSLLVSQSLGTAFKQELAQSTLVNSTLHRGAPTDGALDNGVIIHEYGHGLSTRLTGGPSNSNCLYSWESGGLGEGWSDFLALALTARPTDRAETTLTVGRWLLGQDASGTGIRRFPYTTVLNLNPHTFGTTAVADPQSGNVGAVHDVGAVWATMLWEVYWTLVTAHGFDANLYHGSGGNNLALQLVIDGLKLQPCNPTFVEARDAILQADLVNNSGVNSCRIWAAFAKRGLGYSANAGSSDTVEDAVEAFDLPPSCTVAVTPMSQAICAPAEAQFAVRLGATFTETATLSLDGVPTNTVASFSDNPIAPLAQSTLTIANTAATLPGWYQLAISGAGTVQHYTTSAALHVASAAPAPPSLTLPLADATAVAATPNFVWTATPQAINYTLEIATDESFSTLLYSSTVASTAVMPPLYLQADARYWWRVTAHNGCGNSMSTTASFIVRAFPRVLLVDDDGSADAADVRAYYADALTALNIGYDQWDTGNGLAEPEQIEQIADYATIIWFTGPEGQRPSARSQALLADFLDGGRCLVVSAQDYHYYAGTNAFMQDYLGVAAIQEDLGDGLTWQTVVTGTVGPFAGLGPYALNFTGANYTDMMTPTVAAGVAFVGDQGNAALYKDGGHYRTSYWAFGFETLPDAQARTATMQRLLNFCDFQSDLGLTQRVTPATALQPGQMVTYTLSYSNSGVAPASGSIISATLPAALTDLTLISSSTPLSPTVGPEVTWAVGDLAPGATGQLTLTGIISPDLAADSVLTLQSTISAVTYERTPANNRTATTQPIVVPRLQLVASTLSGNEADQQITVVATLDQANRFGTVQADYQITDGTAQAGSDYQATTGRLTIAAGALTTTITIPITDDLALEGDETLFVTLHNGRGASLGGQVGAAVTIHDDDQPTIGLSSATYTATEKSGVAVVTVQLNTPQPLMPVTVAYQTADGSAQATTDYQGGNGLLTIPAGSSAFSLTIPLIDDGVIEGDEHFVLALSTATNAQLQAPVTATITIVDDEQGPDSRTPTVVINSDPPAGSVLTVGDQINYTVVITNHSSNEERMTVTATLSSNVRYVAGSANPTPTGAMAAGVTANGATLSWTAAVSAGGHRQISFVTQIETITDPVTTTLAVAVSNGPLVTPAPVVHNAPPTETPGRALFLPLVQR